MAGGDSRESIRRKKKYLGKTKSTVKVGSWSAVRPPSRRSHNRTLFLPKSTRSNFRGACEKLLLDGHPNRILGFSDYFKNVRVIRANRLEPAIRNL